MLEPGDLPNLFDVADLLLRAVLDPERVAVRVRPPTGHRVAEPVGLLEVGAEHAQGLPLPAQQPVRGRQHLDFLASSGTRAAVPGRQYRSERQLASGSTGNPGELLAGHLPRRPGRPDHLVPGPPGHLGRGHPGRPADVPAEP